MTGKILSICVASARHGEQVIVEAVQLKAGRGIVGDRFFGFRKSLPGKNLTLIEAEAIAGFNQRFGQNIPLHATRRNLITQGIQLNELTGKTFRIGSVLCRGIELCEPCKIMARQFPAVSLSQNEIISAFTHKGGLRAEVLSDGIVHLDDLIIMDTGRVE